MLLLLFHDRGSLADVASLKSALEELYGPYGLRVLYGGFLYVPFPGIRLNAARLLKHLSHAAGSKTALWLVDKEIFYPGIGPVFGCATERIALLSASGLEPEVMQKEALHETGHLLGLDHCHQRCIMSLSRNLAEAEEKPISLCPRCSAALASLATDAGEWH